MTTTRKQDSLALRSQDDVVVARQRTRSWAVEAGLNLIDQTKLVTAASELARNTLDYGGGGEVLIAVVGRMTRRKVEITFTDQGPGIPDIAQALKDGHSTGGGLGLGLGGAKRLCKEFEIRSVPGEGTVVKVASWTERP